MKNEIILYQSDNLAEHVEVLLDKDTVWLSLNQIAQLFKRDKSVVSRHLRNIYKEGELSKAATVAKNATVQIEAGREVKREIDYYNLDAIISVGYRVNSKQGTQFRIWATNVLRDYLLKGYAINQRMDRLENNYENLSEEVQKISLQLKTQDLPNRGIFFEGEIFDAYIFASQLIKSARHSIILVDNYIDETVLQLLAKRQTGVKVQLYTAKLSETLKLDLKKHAAQYGEIEVQVLKKSHDRFLILDDKKLYHFGASIKDLGKKPVVSEVEPWFAFSRMDSLAQEVIQKLNTK